MITFIKSQRNHLLVVLLLLATLPLHAIGNKAQTNPSIQIQQPSSEAQSLGKFAEIPVDLYTGRTNISIPLFTISYNDIEIPISLSYHGGGIKVIDEAGTVGLGWTLNASGVVNRIVRGMPDELYINNEIADGKAGTPEEQAIEQEKRDRNEVNSIYYENIVREKEGYPQRGYNYSAGD